MGPRKQAFGVADASLDDEKPSRDSRDSRDKRVKLQGQERASKEKQSRRPPTPSLLFSDLVRLHRDENTTIGVDDVEIKGGEVLLINAANQKKEDMNAEMRLASKLPGTFEELQNRMRTTDFLASSDPPSTSRSLQPNSPGNSPALPEAVAESNDLIDKEMDYVVRQEEGRRKSRATTDEAMRRRSRQQQLQSRQQSKMQNRQQRQQRHQRHQKRPEKRSGSCCLFQLCCGNRGQLMPSSVKQKEEEEEFEIEMQSTTESDLDESTETYASKDFKVANDKNTIEAYILLRSARYQKLYESNDAINGDELKLAIQTHADEQSRHLFLRLWAHRYVSLLSQKIIDELHTHKVKLPPYLFNLLIGQSRPGESLDALAEQIDDNLAFLSSQSPTKTTSSTIREEKSHNEHEDAKISEDRQHPRNSVNYQRHRFQMAPQLTDLQALDLINAGTVIDVTGRTSLESLVSLPTTKFGTKKD